MRNSDSWRPSKFVRSRGRLTSSRDTQEVSIGSRLIVDIIARYYEAHLSNAVRGRLLDLGCGKVPLYDAYKHLITDVVCVDWGNSLHDNRYLDCECDLNGQLPFSDGDFDTVILSDVLEHISDPEHLWREIARVLRGGGKLIMNVPFLYWLHESPHDYYRYTEFALRRFAHLSNFSVVYLSPIGGVPEVLADICAKSVARFPVVGKPAAIAIQSIASGFVGTSWGRRASSASGARFPLGYFLIAEKARVDHEPIVGMPTER